MFLKTPKLRPVIVVWNDASFNLDQMITQEEIDNSYQHEFCVTTVGFLLRKDKKAVYLAGDMTSEGCFRHINTIPMAMVRKITYLKGGA